ncbi:MAG TPA: translocation/assembly module TamB domain-containing protein [Thermoanaerobaculia bacterium]
MNDPADPLLPHPPGGRHRSARERQRRGPMWGCLKGLMWVFGVAAILLIVIFGGGWWYLGTTSFEGLVAARIEKTLEERLGRDVTIGSVQIVRTRPQKVILNDLRIANAPGAKTPYFATVRQIEIIGGVESFWSRRVKVGRVDIRDPHLWFEVFPEGAPLVHNFPQWKTTTVKRRFEILHLEIGKLFIANGAFDFLDRRHDISAVSKGINSTVTITSAQNLYAGVMSSPLVRVRLQDYEPFDLDLRGGFRYTPGVLALQSIALKGRGIEAFLAGKLDPLTEGQYDLRVTSRIGLERIREIFRVEKLLEGTLALDTRLAGKQGDFVFSGGWASDRIVADAYELADARGKLHVTGDGLTLDVDRATYGGGRIGAHYALTKYAEPYPMSVDLRYYGISIEQLFNDWTVEGTGLRTAATGKLTYRWNKDKILEGSGEGTAQLAKNGTAFSNAQYPIPISGSTDFALNNGVVTFRRAELDTTSSHISLAGTLRIEDLLTDLRMSIRSQDFSELDRIGFNFAHAADKRDYELLGLGGAGTITGTVQGKMESPRVAANIVGTAIRYNEITLGNGDLALRYDGDRATLTFERALFTDANGRLAFTGTVGFPDRGPSPTFDIAVEANNYPAQRAIDAMGLDFRIGEGLATGRMVVSGNTESGKVSFAGLTIRRADAELRLAGDVRWLPGEGNIDLDLQINARDFPIRDIISFLDLGDLPVKGDLTGTLALKGPKTAFEGKGTVTVRRGEIYGEAVDLASADIAFTQGRVRATNVLVQAPAGEVRGEAEFDLNTEQFSYTISSGALDLSRFKLLESMSTLLGGNVTLRSTGAGTFANPELVVEATLNDATLRGLQLPAGTPPPSLYIAIRGGRLIVRGAVGELVTIEGEGAVGENLAVDGLVRVVVSDIARLAAISPKTSTIPAEGNLVLDLRLMGRLSPIEELIVEATVPTLNLSIANNKFTAPEPLRLTLRNGRIEFDAVTLQGLDSTFAVTGFAELTGEKRADIDIRGRVEAALLQLFMADVRAEGHVDVAMSLDGSLTDPTLTGTATLVDAQVRFPGLPQLIDAINGTLRFRGDRLEIEGVRARLGGGDVFVGGFLTLDGLMPQSARITLQGSDVALRLFEGITIEGNFTLLLSGDLERSLITGDVAVTRGLYFRDFDIQQLLLNAILARSRVTPLSAATWQDRVGLRLRLAAPGTLAVRNNIADVTGSADLEVTGTLANPVILGEVELDEGGTVRIQKIDYRVARGTVAFQNPFRIDPFFDVTIEGTVSGSVSEIESGPIDLTVNITGTLDHITPTITSDPPASDITLFSILGFGQLTGRNGETANVGLLGQSLLVQSLTSLIGSRVLPFVDSFAYDPGTLDTGAGSGGRVTFEKRLSDEIRFLLVYNLETSQSRQAVEWIVNRNWTVQLTRDETDEYRVDARFRRRYDARWELGGGGSEGEMATTATEVAENTNVEAVAAPPVTNVDPMASANAPITQINFIADARFDTTAVADDVTLEPGERLSIRELQSSIKNLYATGNFRDVRVDAAPTELGVALTFSLFLHYRVGEVAIEGLTGGERTRAQRDMTMRTGEVLSLNAVDDSAIAIQEALRRNGYLEATVDPETTFDRARSLAGVRFHVTPGPVAQVAQVIIEGDVAPFNAPQLIEQMRRGPGSTFQVREAREDAERIRNFMIRREHRRADVDFIDHTYDRETHQVTLRYRASAGPKVRVEVAGVPRRSVRRLLPFRGRNDEYSEDAIDRAAEAITVSLQRRGHFRATVDTESGVQDGVWVTTFHVSPGQRYQLAEVEFAGNIKVPENDLHKTVATTPRGGIRRIIATLLRRPQGVTREQLEDDRDAVESYYRLHGFSEATVATPEVLTNDATGAMAVRFAIEEGPQTLVADVRVEGNQEVRGEDLPRLQLRAGEPLNPQQRREDIVALQTFYANRGNVEVQVADSVTVSEDKTSATVRYVITEGPRVQVDEIIVRGNTYTDRDVVLRRSNLDSGDAFTYTSILEAQRELYRLGIFNRVDIQPEQAGTTVGDRDVVIQVEEGRNLTLTGSLGVRAQRVATEEGSGTDVSPRLALAAAHRNLFGTGRYLGLEGVRSREETEAFLTYREPFISRWDVPLQLQLFQTDDATRPGITIEQRGASLEASKVAFSRTRWSMRYEYKISECKEGTTICDEIIKGNPVADIDRSLLNIQISSFQPTFFWDRRDDILDPHSGFFTSASVEYASPVFSANAHFLKEYVQGAYYIPISDRQVIAISGRVGLIQPKGGTDHSDVPLSERFTAGGETTHRAFELDLLGSICRDPKDFSEGFCGATLFQRFDEDENRFVGPILPLGGSGLLLVNAEYRFPIAGTFGGALFADAGQVYATDTIRFDQLRYGVGVGVRYLSPVGPLRLDFGYKLDRRIIGTDADGNPKREDPFAWVITFGLPF